MQNIDELKQTFKQVKIKHFNSNTYRGTHVALVTKENRVYLSAAKCNPQDAFSRKTGRDIALGRALQRWKEDAGIVPERKNFSGKVVICSTDEEIDKVVEQNVFAEPRQTLEPVYEPIGCCGGCE